MNLPQNFTSAMVACLVLSAQLVFGFAPINRCTVLTPNAIFMSAVESKGEDPQDIIGKTIIVKGDVNGGYIRTCINNEAGKFRRLIGTMSPPDNSSDTATIYVEGKRKMVDGFVRWCERGSKKVGLSQSMIVVETTDEVPTGLYDGFYLRTLEE